MNGIGRGRNPYAARPGRAQTYFNNPYMGQIADNLSTAIYGDPRDELVREQIVNQQVNRERQQAQDNIKRQADYDKNAAIDSLGLSIVADPEGKEWRSQVPDALKAGVSIEQIMGMAGLNDPRYLQKLAMQDDRQEHNVATAATAQENTVFNKNLDHSLATVMEKVKHGYRADELTIGHNLDEDGADNQLYRDIAMLTNKHNYNVDLEGVKAGNTLLGQTFGDITSKGGIDPALNARLADAMGIDRDEFGNYNLYTSKGLQHGSPEAAAAESSGGKPTSFTPTMVKQGKEHIKSRLIAKFGAPSEALIDPEVGQRVFDRATELYQLDPNWQTAVEEAITELIEPEPKQVMTESNWLSPDVYETRYDLNLRQGVAPMTGIPQSQFPSGEQAPGEQAPKRIKFDAQGNQIP